MYKNLLQETSHRAGLNLPVYTTVRSGPAHLPVFTSTVELAGLSFVGESAKTKKQAEKNAAIAAWSALKTSTTTTTTTHYFPSFLKLTLSFVFFFVGRGRGRGKGKHHEFLVPRRRQNIGKWRSTLY